MLFYKKQKRLLLKIGLIVYSLALLQTQVVNGQANQEVDDLVNWSEDGMVVFASDAGLSEEFPQSERVAAIIYRKLTEEGEYQEITRVQAPVSVEELRERSSERFIQQLMDETNSNSEEALLQYIRSNSRLDHYGFLSFNPDLWRMLGTAYTDTETLNFEEGQRVWYKVRYLNIDGSISEGSVEGSDIVGSSPDILPPQSVDRLERDSLVAVTWASPISGSEDAYFARVYRQKADEDAFTLLDEPVMARRTSDSLIVYQHEEQAEPEQVYRFFIKPVDLVGNPGPTIGYTYSFIRRF